MLSVKRTGSLTCRTPYDGSTNSSCATLPVTFEITVKRG
jgi:hypothetical protein